MSKNIHTVPVDYLFEAILSLKNKEECYTFFEDICTVNELLSLYSMEVFEQAEKEDKQFLQTFTFICTLCFDIYTKKQLLEHLIDLSSSYLFKLSKF